MTNVESARCDASDATRRRTERTCARARTKQDEEVAKRRRRGRRIAESARVHVELRSLPAQEVTIAFCSRVEAARVAEEAKNHFETGRCSDSDGFSARHHSSREYGYYEQFRGFRSGPERRYE